MTNPKRFQDEKLFLQHFIKTIHILFILLLLTLSAEAQSLKSNFIKTLDAINTILYQNQKAQFVNQEGSIL